MPEIIKVGIIGCGGIANGKHMPALQKVADCEMVAFCDIVEERAVLAAKEFGTENAAVYTDYRELLKDKTIDVVHVCTPNRSHSFITVDALEAGKHVMCEKPMAINSKEAKKMLDAAKRTGKKLSIGYQSRFRPDAQYLKKEADSGIFGDIYYAKATALRRRAVPTWGVFLNEYEQGGGPLIDIGTHALDLTLWTINNYKPKYCLGTTYHKLNTATEQGNMWGNWDIDKFTVEDSAFGFIVMENGATIVLESAWALNTLDVREAVTSFCGTKAGADMNDGLRINGVRNNTQYVLKPDFKSGGVAFNNGDEAESAADMEERLWIEAVRNNTEPVTTPDQAYVVTRILEGIYESAKTGTIYKFED
ncbi:MAG: Gfo/Idh/MocA family oxidoreductase [Acutalibacteraceae bacterium]|nr:Gfo/Idh/MocA family oxidoreductase [Acutalibacteraceae bacterium]